MILTSSQPTRNNSSVSHTPGKVKLVNGWTNYHLVDYGDSQNLMVIWPFFNHETIRVSEIGMRIAGTIESLFYRVGFYNLDGVGGKPSTLIADCGQFEALWGAKVNAGLDFVLPQGFLGIALVAQGADGTGGFQTAIPGVVPVTDGFYPLSNAWSEPGVTDALPAVTTAADYDGYAPPAIWAKPQ